MKIITLFSMVFLLFTTSFYTNTNNINNSLAPNVLNSNDYYILNTPIITSFSPTSGLIGATVTILGNDFNSIPENNLVEFNGIQANVISATETSITVLVPTGATSGAITITVGSESAISSSIFTVVETSTCNGISNNSANHWYFGNQAAIKFENNIPIALTNSAMTQVEGVASISDANGNLLFYTNGITIFNKNHQVMANGTGLTSNSSNTQAAFIVPFPQNVDKYFVITPGPYNYSIVDMTLDNGNGAVISTAKNIPITNENSEKVAGLLASNQTDVWLITYGANQKRFNVYKITPNGINMTPIISEFSIASGFFGYMKISPDGTKIALANFNQSFHLYDFDASSGIVSNQKVISFTNSIGGFGSYGIEFSPNNNLVYVSDHRGQNRVFQFDITMQSPELIANSMIALETNTVALGAIQLGPDKKIYVARENNGFLGVIHNPDVVGTECNYVAEGMGLGGKTSNLGLPGFVASSLVQNQPYITSFSPTTGEEGTTVTIIGTDFSTILSNNIVTFNGVEATVIAATSTSLTVLVPIGATTGSIGIAIGCDLVSSTDIFTLENLGIHEDVVTEPIMIYPNPTSDILHINLKTPLTIQKIAVFDPLGKLVLTKDTNPSNINIQHIKNGLYFIKVYTAKGIYSKKIIKK
ncbi:MAG: IPT/TIG domain-containing protein [Gelidibacter sp.]